MKEKEGERIFEGDFLDRVASGVGGGSVATSHLRPSEVFLGTNHKETCDKCTLWLET